MEDGLEGHRAGRRVVSGGETIGETLEDEVSCFDANSYEEKEKGRIYTDGRMSSLGCCEGSIAVEPSEKPRRKGSLGPGSEYKVS